MALPAAGRDANAEPPPATEVVVAVAAPLSGPYAAYGAQIRAGAEAAIRAANATATMADGAMRLVVEDDACDRQQATAVATRLIAQKVALVIGHHCAGASIAAAPLYAAAGVIQITPGTSLPALTDRRAGPTLFRMAARSDREGVIAGTYIARQLAHKRVAILHDRTVIGIELAGAAKRAMNAAGLKEVLHSGFIAGEPDYGRLARDLRAYRVDALYLAAYPNEARLISRALKEQGGDITIFGSSLLVPSEGISDSTALEGVIVTAPVGGDERPLFAELSEARLPRGVTAIRANAYATVQVWNAARRSVDRPDQTARAIQTGRFDTIIGPVSFDAKGDAEAAFTQLYTVKSGHLVPAP